jgi:hypothetical protein
MDATPSISKTYTAPEVCAALGVTPQWLAAKIKKGLPCKGKGTRRRFDEEAVTTWLTAQGLAEHDEAALAQQQGPIAYTVNEAVQMLAAKGLKVDKRTFQDWIGKPDFPGRAGRPGRRDAHFPIPEIIAWHGGLTNRKGESPEETRRGRLLDLQIAQKEIELAKAQGEVIDRHVASTIVDQLVTNLLALMTPLADELTADLPAEFQGEARAKVERRVDHFRVSAADVIAKYAKEEEQSRAQRVFAKNP